MWHTRPAGYVMVMVWIFVYFNGLTAQENLTLVTEITVVADVIPVTEVGPTSANKDLTRISEQVISLPYTNKTSNDPSKITTAIMESPRNISSSSSLTVSPRRLKPTYGPPEATSQMIMVTSPPEASDDNIYILVGAACTGFLALGLFIILILFICKRCRRNDYTKAESEPQNDDEKGDISGPRWVFNDDRQDWLYDGADDEDDNQYVGPLPGQTGKRSSLMDKRYTHDSETFGRASPSEPRKRPPLVVSGSMGTLEGLTFGEDSQSNKDEITTDDIGLTESNIDEKIDIDSCCSGVVEDETKTDNI